MYYNINNKKWISIDFIYYILFHIKYREQWENVIKEKDFQQKNYNVEELYVARLKNDESAIYYIAEIYESLKGFLINTKNKKPQ